MPTPAELEAEIDTLRLELRDLQDQIPQAIATALRTYADRPAGEKGAPSAWFGLVEEVFDTWAFITPDGQTAPVPINMLGGLVVDQRALVLLFPPSGNIAIGMVTPTVVPSVPGTPGASGFPVGPYDDGTATHEIVTGAPGFGIAYTRHHTTSDATGVDVNMTTAVLDGLLEGGASLNTITPTGDVASVVAAAKDATSATAQMTSGAVGAPNPAQFTAFTTPSSSSATVYATYVEINGVGDVRVISPAISFNGQLTSPTIPSASEFAFWLDDTPGATVLHVKAKDSGGTVRVASIPLA